MFDDVHWINGKADLEEALSLLIERAPTNVHFIVIRVVQNLLLPHAMPLQCP